MPPANEITVLLALGMPKPRSRSSSAAAMRAARESSAVQSMAAGAVGAAGARRPVGGPATNVPCPTWARARPEATSSS